MTKTKAFHTSSVSTQQQKTPRKKNYYGYKETFGDAWN